MAYQSSGIKAMTSGSGKAPGIFTYNTDDLVSEVTTAGYFQAGLFSANDIVFVVAVDSTGFTKLICVDEGKGENGAVDMSTVATFTGDVRATDEAGFQSDNLGVGLGAAQGVFMTYTYRNNTDPVATIVTDGYFADCELFMQIGDVVEIIGNDGHAMIMITGVSGTVTNRLIAFV